MHPIQFLNIIAMLVLGISMLVTFFSRSEDTFGYFKLGLMYAGSIVGIGLIFLFLAVPGFWGRTLFSLLFSELIAILKISIAFSVGCYCCISQKSQSALGIRPSKISWLDTSRSSIVSGLIFAVFTFALFSATNPQVAEGLIDLSQDLLSPSDQLKGTILLIFAVVQAAFVEEIVYRLGIQNFLARYLTPNSYFMAVAITSALWAIAHYGQINPNWIKFVQIFSIGIFLGYLFRSRGLITCILAHGSFNIIAAVFARHVID